MHSCSALLTTTATERVLIYKSVLMHPTCPVVLLLDIQQQYNRTYDISDGCYWCTRYSTWSTAVVVLASLQSRYAPGGNTDTIPPTGHTSIDYTPRAILPLFIVVVPVSAKRFHTRYSGQAPLLKRLCQRDHCSSGTVVTIAWRGRQPRPAVVRESTGSS